VNQPDNAPRRALWNATIVVILIVVFAPVRSLRLPLLLAAGVLGCLNLVRSAFRIRRGLGISVCLLLLACVCAALGSYLWIEQSHATLLGKLAKYDDATFQWKYLALPHVFQLSVRTRVTDDDLREIVAMPDFAKVSELYLDSNSLTDACLRNIEELEELEYVFIDSDNITNDAIISFEARHPVCRVIAYGRDLHEGNRVTLGSP
jgi:hypothetical protein